MVGLLPLLFCTVLLEGGGARLSPERWYPHRLIASPPSRLPGPFACDSLSFFIVHHGGPLTVEFIVHHPSPQLTNHGVIRLPHAVFWQFYDSEEKLVKQEYYKFIADDELERVFCVVLSDAAPGILQFRYAKSPGNTMTVDLRTEPTTSFGVMPCRARLYEGARGQFEKAYLYVPPSHYKVRLITHAGRLTVVELAGNVIASTSGQTPLDVEVKWNRVYQIRAESDYAVSAIGIAGVPPILCANEVTARNIRGSIEVAPDGPVLHRKFQLRMWERMHSLKPKDLAVKAVALLPLKDEWLKDPRNAGLLGIDAPFNQAPRILRCQDLNPRSPTYGQGINASWLGPAYVIDKPFNPYRRNKAILNRILLYESSRFLELMQNGTFNPNNWDHYAGGDMLGYRKRAFQFGYVAPLVDEKMQELWSEGE